MPTAIVGQNGAQVKQTTTIAVSGCPKPKRARPAKRGKRTERVKRAGRAERKVGR